MSLWSHGNDREVYRAQHLFCHRAKEQLAYLAPAPSPDKNSICLELAVSGNDLLCGVALAHDCVAGDFLSPSHHAPGLECLDCEINGGGGVVVRHADGIGRDPGSGA